MDQNQRLILSEFEDRVEQIFAAIEQLREVSGEGRNTRRLLDAVFRDVHSLKAAASLNGLNDVVGVAHAFENLLHSLRTGKSRLNDEVLQVCDETATVLFASLDVQRPPDSRARGSLFRRLENLSGLTSRRGIDVAGVLEAIPAEIRDSLNEAEKHSLEESVTEGAGLFVVEACFDVAEFDRHFQELKDRLSKKGEVISTAPRVDSARPEKVSFKIVYARDADAAEIIQELSGFSGITVDEIPGYLASTATSPGEQNQGIATKVSALGDPQLTAKNSVRISLADLDRIISSTHKLLRQATGVLAQAAAESPETVVKAGGADLRRSFLELSAELVNLRMVSVDRMLQRAVRAGRSAMVAAGKQVDFVLEGRGLQLDKSLCEAIADPLIHLVRNAVDHGIENTQERARLGKDRRGKIRIEAATLQGQTRITVTDDGRGIDPAIVAKAAERVGALEPGVVISLERSVRLLFRPGLSTATEVSGISGRGVGLDVVETAVEEVGGAVRVTSQLGKGSAFEIRLPVTFGLLDVVPVVVADQRYLIDASHFVSSQSRKTDGIEISDTGESIRIDGETSPLFQLCELLGRAPAELDNQSSLLLCQLALQNSGETGRDRVALLVDEIGETQQVLIRNLGSRGGRWFGVAGAAELSDGVVVLLLDLPRLVIGAREKGQNINSITG